MSILLGIVLFLAIIMPLVIIHEYGHFLVAQRNGVKVDEFGIGFPPRLVSKTLGKGIWRAFYTINLLPLGGFVKLKGESDADRRPGSFGSVRLWPKAKILLAGVTANYLLAIILFSVVAAIRLPVIFDHQYTVASDTTVLRADVVAASVVPGSPADRAGLRRGDRLVKLAGTDITNADATLQLTKEHRGQQVELVYERDGQQTVASVQLPDKLEPSKGYLGVGPHDRIERRSTWSAPVVGFVVTHQVAWESLKALGSGIGSLVRGDSHGASQAGITGPIGIVSLLREGIGSLSQFLLLMASISLSLALLNAMPIPALDGGRLALIGLFRLLRRPLSEKLEQTVHTVGFVALMGLVLVVSVFDVKTFF